MARIISIFIISIIFYSCSVHENKKKDRWVALIENELEIKISGFKNSSSNIKCIINFNGSIDTSYLSGSIIDIMDAEEHIIPSIYNIEKNKNKIHLDFTDADRPLKFIELIMNDSDSLALNVVRLEYQKHYWLYKSKKVIEFTGQDFIKISGFNKSLFQDEQQFCIQYIKL